MSTLRSHILNAVRNVLSAMFTQSDTKSPTSESFHAHYCKTTGLDSRLTDSMGLLSVTAKNQTENHHITINPSVSEL